MNMSFKIAKPEGKIDESEEACLKMPKIDQNRAIGFLLLNVYMIIVFRCRLVRSGHFVNHFFIFLTVVT